MNPEENKTNSDNIFKVECLKRLKNSLSVDSRSTENQDEDCQKTLKLGINK